MHVKLPRIRSPPSFFEATPASPLKYKKEGLILMKKIININGTHISVNDDVYYTYHKMWRYEKTLKEKDARNKVIQIGEWSDRHLRLFSGPDSTPEDIVIRRQTQRLLYECLAALSQTERDLIRALFFEEKTMAALSKQLEIPTRTLGYRRDRILRKLRKMMVSGGKLL